ncbi:S8 family serine peptidase [Cecembia calidifontis]|uniref:Putative secreted protein (Por secretion system target) n=1 Tax=Cecembia calidifontis TaxID=1187080 RepID=A0A4V2F680_9BACT|nr:S8 family serine peptidase [Cecembia calidifontis]RZS95389.1 putative secreted protein (Por secretion system target) [Cecembia calidifontis]
MKRSFFIALLLLGSIIANAQEYYYWANGEKYFLELYAEKQYILIQGQNKIAIAKELEVSEQSISELKPIILSSTINNDRASKPVESNQYWAFVNSTIDKAKVESSGIVYAAPSFLVNGKEIGLSQYFYVKLRKEKDIEILESLARDNQVEIIGNDSFMPLWYILSCDKNSKGNALEMANLFYELGYFDSAEPDLMEDFLMGCTNDPLFAQQWHLNNTGQAGGTVGNDIRACQAWNITTGCANIVVAVLDHGLEFNHPDFNNISPISFDTENGTPPSVVRGNHGVAVAGVIGATRNNTLGVSGVSPDVQLMSISNNLVLAPLLSQRLANGINFAWQNGAAIINNSWGSNAIEQQGLINDAINNAVTQGRGGLGTIVICITHNQSTSSIAFPSNNPQTIAVGAINRTPSRASFSNYGTGIDVVAPGVSISTTDRQGALGYNQTAGPNGDYTSVDGTSFAAPQVAGIAALILSVNPALTLQQVRNAIESSTDKVGNYTYTLGAGEQPNLTWNNQMGYGRVNAFRALQTAFPITGPNLICTNGTYNLQNQPAGTTITWSSSNPNGLAINPTTGVATRQNNFSGPITLTATINGGCAPVNLTRNIWVGNPGASVSTLIYPVGLRGVNPVTLNASAIYQFRVDQVEGFPTSWTWILPQGFSFYSGSTTSTPYIMTSSSYGNYTMHCRVNNACGFSYTNSLDIILQSGGGGTPLRVRNDSEEAVSEEVNSLEVQINKNPYPNPATDAFNIEVEELSILTLTGSTGQKILSVSGVGKITILVADLSNGIYFLSITNGSAIVRHKVLIQR